MSNNINRVAIVGYGHIAQTYLEVLAEHPEFLLCAIVEPKEIACPEGVKYYPSVDELLEAFEKPTMAVVCTPPAMHFATTKALLEGGVDCLVEKPFTTKVEEADTLQHLAHKLDRKLRTAGKFRFALQDAQQAIIRGEIGKLVRVENTFSGIFDPHQDWHAMGEVSGGGVWMDNGPHALDVLESLAGPITKIRLVDVEYSDEIEEELTAETVHQNGARGFATLSWKNKIDAPIAVCHGSLGEMMIGWNQYDKAGSFAALLEDFLHGENEDHGKRSLQWIEKGYESLKSGKWESLHD